ncbi:SDR family oxidoreductase [Microbacterium halophytorum]|uniref:SDR family oxidoreductase n=1 Tax=Microbacterium halophytorum TaxID=2067568 RepID=UPI000CFAB0C8|nr:SDR family oxidoreductase [Microbacterium halophytorum]
MNELFDVSGRLAFVTGSSRGLGRSLALALAQAGARVVLHGRDEAALEETRAALVEATGADVSWVSFDVMDAGAVEQGVSGLVAEHGVPDVLVNNAGLQSRAPFTEFAVSDWDRVIASNLSSAFYVSRFVTPGMAERGSGKVINIGSVQSVLARQTIAPYSASKGGVVMLTKGMAADLARFDVQVNAISPGYFATEMNRALVEDEAFNAWLIARTPAQRWGDFRELWGTLIYLASDASSFVSGQNILVDGGMTAVV